jgi:hypothetical protein
MNSRRDARVQKDLSWLELAPAEAGPDDDVGQSEAQMDDRMQVDMESAAIAGGMTMRNSRNYAAYWRVRHAHVPLYEYFKFHWHPKEILHRNGLVLQADTHIETLHAVKDLMENPCPKCHYNAEQDVRSLCRERNFVAAALVRIPPGKWKSLCQVSNRVRFRIGCTRRHAGLRAGPTAIADEEAIQVVWSAWVRLRDAFNNNTNPVRPPAERPEIDGMTLEEFISEQQ